MKKIIILMSLAATTLGCAYGINHNVATINGEQYLVENRNHTFLYFAEWSDAPRFYKLDEEALSRSAQRQYLEKLKEECKAENPYAPAVKKCIQEKLAK